MIETSLSFFLLLIMTSGGLVAQWSVTYTPTDICALEGSSVNMFCSYTYPWGLTVEQAYWINQEYGDAVDLSKIEPYGHRVTVDCRDKSSGCSLQMTKLTKADAQYQYYCRITTNDDKEKWIGRPGISLKVTDLKVVSSGQGAEMMAGDHVSLTCSTTCRLTGSPSFIWSKDGHTVGNNNQLQLHPVRYEDGGSYTCAVKGHETLPSPPMWINVMCQTVITSDREAVQVGDHVTLTCSTTCTLSSSPSFIWSKDGRPVEKNQNINNQLQLRPVRYEDGSSYTCAVKGHETLHSPPMRINVTCQTVITSDREAVQVGDHVTLTCNTTCTLSSSPSFIWSKDGRPVEKKQNINNQLQLQPVRYEDGGNYTCAVTRHEDRPSPPFHLNVCQTVITSDSEAVKVGDHVTLTCNTSCTLSNSPSFIWSKDGRPVEKNQNINNQLQLHPVRYEDGGNYTCAVTGHDYPSPPFRFQVMSVDHIPVIAAVVGVAVCGVVGLLCVIYWLRLHKGTTSRGPQRGDTEGQDDVQYSNVNFQRSGQSRAAGPSTAETAEDDVQYSTIQPKRSRETAGAQGDDVHYASVHFKKDAAAKR